MASGPWLTTEGLHTLRQIDTCMVANAIDSFHVHCEVAATEQKVIDFYGSSGFSVREVARGYENCELGRGA
jgi:hypothetical protein